MYVLRYHAFLRYIYLYVDLFFKHVIYFQIQGLYDVIMGNMKDLVTLLFFKIKSTNLASWGILIQIFQKII